MIEGSYRTTVVSFRCCIQAPGIFQQDPILILSYLFTTRLIIPGCPEDCWKIKQKIQSGTSLDVCSRWINPRCWKEPNIWGSLTIQLQGRSPRSIGGHFEKSTLSKRSAYYCEISIKFKWIHTLFRLFRRPSEIWYSCWGKHTLSAVLYL